MISLIGIRFVIEFSSILVLAFLCIMHEFTDVTFAKQFNIDHTANQANFEDVEQASFHQIPQNAEKLVEFKPESLDFEHHPIGMPVVETVYVYNKHDEINIQMISISGYTEHFHCSFFEDKIVPPRSNTSFQVVFLARQEGLVNNTLYIHSSIGSFQYRVSATGDVSPFRVRPLIGARVPLNSSFASLIYIYNPFSTPLQLTEMYSSGGGLHLELPEDDYEVSSSLWKVPPYETRPVMKAHFVARIASNHTSYIRIRTNATDVHLMLPVEVEVSSLPGLYSPVDTLDFGVLRAKHDPPKILPIQVINAATKSIYVQNIVVTPISDGLNVDFSGPLKLTPRSSIPYNIANLILDPSQFSCSGFCVGKVLIKSKNNQYKLSIPFIVRIIQGELYFNNSQSHFFINQSSNYSEQRILTVTNRFEAPIIIHDIILPDEAKPYFKLTTKPPFSLPVVVPVGSPFPLIRLEFTPSPQLSHFSTTFRLLTNYSHFDLPLYAYRGRLDLFIPNSSDQSKLDIGLVGLNEHKMTTFVVANHNPIAIRLIYWRCNLTGITVELVGTSQGNVTAVSQRIEPPGLSRSEATLLQPDHFAVFRVHINKLSTEGLYDGFISITTAYQTFNVPLMLKVLRGSLTAEKVILPKTFPGKIVKGFLNIKSNYTSHLKIKGAFIEPKDDRFKIKLIDQLIKPGQENQLQITFDASVACFKKLCYSAIDIEKEVGKLWILGNGLYSDTAYIDKELYKLLRNQWLMLKEEDRNPTVTVRLQIDGFGSLVNHVQAQQQWPRISNKLAIRFPSIRIGKSIVKELLIENPADRPVLLQAINVIDYPNSEILLQQMSNLIFHHQWSRNDLLTIHKVVRSEHTLSAFSLANNNSTAIVNRLDEWLKVVPHPNSVILLLPPGARHRLAVTFCPLDEKNFTSLLILRNNLTIIDVVLLRGEGGRGLLKIGKTLPNLSNSKLIFEFSERGLERRCRNGGGGVSSGGGTVTASGKETITKSHFNTLVIKEKFKAMNIGRMGLQIRNFLIDGMPCEAYGFRINRCEPIYLTPNQTLDIEIVYSPDFTQPTVSHELSIIVDDDLISAQRFQLVAKIPQKLLRNCHDVLPRPSWEEFLYFILMFMTMFMLMLSVIVAVFDAKRFNYNYFSAINLDTVGATDLTKCEENGTAVKENKCEQVDSIDLSKKSLNGNYNGNVANGKHQHNLNKVRNRKLNKNANYNAKNEAKNNVNNSSNKNKSNGDIVKTVDESKNKISIAQAEQSNQESNDSVSWCSTRKKLLRQDSSSSEHSQRSSDNGSPHSSVVKGNDSENDSTKSSNYKKNDLILNEAVTNKTSHRKSKSKDSDKKSTETKSGKIKAKSTKSAKNEKKSDKSSNGDISKSSTESLTFSIKCEYELPTKVRSATLPLANEKANIGSTESISSSQSNIATSNTVLNNEAKSITSVDSVTKPIKQEYAKLMKNFPDTVYSSSYNKVNYKNCDQAWKNNEWTDCRYTLDSEPVKDIWDLPITEFDSAKAMSILVKQTQQFDEKFSAGEKNVSNSYRKSNSVTKFNDDKWEIGEWSNDLLSKNPQKPVSFSNTGVGAKTNRSSTFSGNESCVAKNRNHRAYDFFHSLKANYKPRSPTSFDSADPLTANGVSNLKSSSNSPNSATFSPVIGRPNTVPSQSYSPMPKTNQNVPGFNDLSLGKNAPFNPAFKSDIFELFGDSSPFPSVDLYGNNNLENIQQNLNENQKSNLNHFFNWNNSTMDAFDSTNSFLNPQTSTSNMFNFENESVWPSGSSWSDNRIGTKNSLFSQFDNGSTPFVSPPVPVNDTGIQSVWPTSTSSNQVGTFPATVPNSKTANNNILNGDRYSKVRNFSPPSNSVWSSLELYDPRDAKPTTSTGTSSTLPPCPETFDNSNSFDLFAKSTWSPLGSTLATETPMNNLSSNTLLSTSQNTDGYYGRFPLNASPSSTTSSTNLSSASSNLDSNNKTQ